MPPKIKAAELITNKVGKIVLDIILDIILA